jgi:hypothetical protein
METIIVPADALVALVDLSVYRSFVAAEWTLDSIRAHFAAEMRHGTMIAWGAGESGNWRIEVAHQSEGANGFREFVAPIRASTGRLHLSSYDELTMAAQFPEVRLPRQRGEDLSVEVEPGWYECRVVQLYDPELDGTEQVFFQESPHFRLELIRTGVAKSDSATGIPWFFEG